jgi:hypothetical protein
VHKLHNNEHDDKMVIKSDYVTLLQKVAEACGMVLDMQQNLKLQNSH